MKKVDETDTSEYEPENGEDYDDAELSQDVKSENGVDETSDENKRAEEQPAGSHVCSICGKQYSRESLYIRHLQTHGIDAGELAKDELSQYLSGQVDGILESGILNKQGVALLQCPYCPKQFERRWNYERHLTIHQRDQSGEEESMGLKKEQTLPCPDCDRKFSRAASLTRHRITQHGFKPNEATPSTQGIKDGIPCPICGYCFKSQDALEKHLSNHAKGEVFICEACGKIFSRQSLFEKHIRRHERGVEFDYVCAVCGKGFNKAGLYRRHMEEQHIHMNITDPKQCKLCKEKFEDENGLREHHCLMGEALQKTQETWACHICPKVFKSQYHLDAHVRMHQGERPFVCSICGKSFTRSDVMRVHMRVHSETKQFQCEVCGQGFRSKFHLSRHMNTHLEKTEVFCEFCGQMFYRLDYFNQHLKKAHIGNLPPPAAPAPAQKKQSKKLSKKGKKGDDYAFIVTDSECDEGDGVRPDNEPSAQSDENPETSYDSQGAEEAREGESEC